MSCQVEFLGFNAERGRKRAEVEGGGEEIREKKGGRAEKAKIPEGREPEQDGGRDKFETIKTDRRAFQGLSSTIFQVHPRDLHLIPHLGHPRAGHSAGQGPATEGNTTEGRARGRKARGPAVTLAHRPSRTGTDIYPQHRILIRDTQHPNLFKLLPLIA